MNKAEDMRLPNVFILGAAKSGTTTLYDILKLNPDIYFPVVKEPQFFSNDQLYEQGIETYLDKHYSSAEGFVYRVDATPHYLYYEKVARRIKHDIGVEGVKFIVILRNPIDRAYSLYWNMVREGYEDLDFESAVNMENERLQNGDLDRMGTIRHQYISSGLYAGQIKTYQRYFGEDSILILFQQDLRDDVNGVLRAIAEFLDLKVVPKIEKNISSNLSSMPRFRRLHNFLRGDSFIKKVFGWVFPYHLKYKIVNGLIELNLKHAKYPPMESSVRIRLKDKFLDDIVELEKMTGRDLGCWK